MRCPPLPLAALVAAACLVATGCAAPPPARLAGEVVVKPTPTPTPVPTPAGPLPQAQPFDVAVSAVRVHAVDSGPLYGAPLAPTDQAVADQAVGVAVDLLTRFLDAQLVQRDTMLSLEGIGALIDPGLVDEPTRRALGALDRDDVLGTATGPASAQLDVHMAGSVVESVLLTYTATTTLVLEDDVAGPLTQSGTLLLAAVQGALSPVAWHPTTTYAGDLSAVIS